MGCGCKQAPVKKTPIERKLTPVNETELDQALSYFVSRTQTQEEANFTIDYHNKYFPEQFPHGYKGDGWLRIRKRLEHQKSQYQNQ